MPGTHTELAVLPKARLSVTTWLAYQPLDREGQDASPPPYCRMIASDEQVWRRTFVVGSEWEPAPLGWLEGQPVAVIAMHNDEGRFSQLQPSSEERAAALARVIEVGIGGILPPVPFTQFRPHESCHFEPLDGVRYFLRCKTDKAKITLTAIPA